jgi:diguanylate cyclase (GGDEF)-like protein
MEEAPGMQTGTGDALTRVRAMFARSDEPYAGGDPVLARRFAVVMWVFGTLVMFVLQAFFPPTVRFGAWGWAMPVAGTTVTAVIVWMLADKRRDIGFNFLYASQYIGLVCIAVTQFLAGGRIAPYHELYMFQLIGAGLMHPPRRVLVFLVAVAGALFAPVFYASATAEPGEIATELFLWTGLALVLLVLMRAIRAQRLALRAEGDEARQLARVDALTGLGNRRAFDEALDAELARARRGGTALSLIVADLNGFKEINDEHGHVRGDDCLRQAATALRSAVRRPDWCFRWGGDEFAILLAGADAEAAGSLAVRVEKAVARSCSRPGGGRLTLTCGHAALDSDMSAGEAVAQADAALLALKGSSRLMTADARAAGLA